MARNNNDDQARGDSALAASARSGDTAAFSELWRRHARAGAAAAAQFASIADADDLVSEAYARILRAMQQGGGPSGAFRPYLYSTIRNIALDWRAKLPTVSLELTPEIEDPDDPQGAMIQRTVTVRAYRSLPERWQAVLWYMDVEGMSPAETSVILGLSPNATSALAVRAREGLKKAWLQAHVNDKDVPPACRWTTERMGLYARGGLTRRTRERFEDHVETCARCSALVAEVGSISGSLASLLLPVTLGGGAGAGLLAELMHEPGRSTPPPAPSSAARVALTTAVGVLVIAAVGTGALAATAPWRAEPTPTASEPDPAPDLPDPDHADQPSAGPTPVSSPTPSLPPTRVPGGPAPAPPLPTPPAVPADTTAPALPQLWAPADGALINQARPTFSGTGEPGALIAVRDLDPATSTLTTLGTVLVGGDGAWAFTPSSSLPDGVHALQVSQRDAAGNESAAATRTITVDTVALVPVLDPLPAAAQFFLPDVTGTGEPGAAVALRDEAGTLLGSATVAQDGTWIVPLPDPHRGAVALAARQTDPASNVSPWSADSAPLSFDRPSIPSHASGTVVPSQGGATVVQVEFAGHAGMHVQVFIDGTSTGNIHTLEATPIQRVTPALPDGAHTIGVRYIDPGTGRVGATETVSIQIG